MNEFQTKVIKTLKYYFNKALFHSRLLRYQLSEVRLVRPIFIVGCSRAGTTLVYKTLSESSCLGTLQKETHDFWADLHPLTTRNWSSHEIPEDMASAADIKKVSQFFYTRTGMNRIVDKNNQNGLSIPYLAKLFPDAHFIYIKRNAGDNINSLIQGWNKALEFATWSEQLPETVAIENGKNKRWCFFLAKDWKKYLHSSIEEVCAYQYEAMNEAILEAKKDIPASQWHELSYEKLIAEPVQEFETIFNGCGIPFDQHVKLHCQNVLQKPYNTFSEIRVEKWKDESNKEKIEKVLPGLSQIVKRMGY